MTGKLFYSDSHILAFEASVLSCECREDGLYLTVLDRTAFFPGGGGQKPDTGVIGGVRVVDAFEKDKVIYHVTESPLTVGETVSCRLDAEQRLRRMQSHSGEHIVSGLVHRNYGFDNVGFHMGEGNVTIDFSGELSAEMLEHIECLANEAVRADLPVKTFFPSSEELKEYDYRSKLELTEDVRLVEIEGIDLCACCAPHVHHTGEVGLIKFLDSMRHRGGTRLTLAFGMDALDAVNLQQRNITEISRLLSAKRDETAAAVSRLMGEKAAQKERIAALSLEQAKLIAAAQPETDGSICLFNDLLDEVAVRELVNLLAGKSGVMAAVFFPAGEGSLRYIIGSKSIDLRKNAKALNAGISGRGGGSPDMIQGSSTGSFDDISSFILGYRPDSV